MKHIFTPIAHLALILVSLTVLSAQDDPNPNSPTPEMLTAADRSRVLAIKADDYRGVVPSTGTNAFKPGPDSRIVLFLNPLELQRDESAGAFRVYLAQRSGKTFEMTNVDLHRTTRGEIAITLRLFDSSGYRGQPAVDGDSWIYVTWRGMASRPLKIGLGRTGGELPQLRGFTASTSVPQSDFVGYRWSRDRTRLLEQASFGPSTAMDERLKRLGPRIWLNEQFDAPYPFIPMPKPPQMPTMPPADCTQISFPTCFQERYTMVPLQQWFFKEAMYSDAQLRLRTAWALSQIWVTSGVVTQQSSHAIAYYEELTRGAFGNYRQLMADLTLNPTMGNYLDMVRSTQANPNENYPREILQLFSIGLVMLNQDGTPKLDNQGNTIPTYDEAVISNLSRVMTGWTFCSTANCDNATAGVVNYRAPMVLVPANHDYGAKSLLSYPGAVDQNIDACAACTTDALRENYAKTSLARALNNIFYHPNVGPYIGKLLIQQFVTSDPSPAYVSRVAAAFNDNGSGTRGDMKAVIKAILLDAEARGDVKTAPRYGKMREPVQILTNLARIFPAVAFNGIGPSDGALSGSATTMGQNPFYSPTVFNYFMPDFVIPGTTIVAPEFEIFNTGTSVKRTNLLHLLTIDGISPNATDSLRGTSLDYSEYVPYSTADATGNQLLDILNARMMHGTLTTAHRNIILPAIQAVPESTPLTRVKTAAYLLACSSQYHIQR